MELSVNSVLRDALHATLLELESAFDADVMAFTGAIFEGPENDFLSIVEQIAHERKHQKLVIVLTTNGGSATVVERYVNVIRHNYDEVIFIVPDYAYSAGTIFCMSGDEIWMDYFSVLGPVNFYSKRLVEKCSLQNFLSTNYQRRKAGINQEEFLILKDFDLAELKGYEQAKELTIALLKEWLVKYKFKSWNTHSNNRIVTVEEKSKRAEEIASKLVNDGLDFVPNDRKYIEALPGVGRKTANVFLSVI